MTFLLKPSSGCDTRSFQNQAQRAAQNCGAFSSIDATSSYIASRKYHYIQIGGDSTTYFLSSIVMIHSNNNSRHIIGSKRGGEGEGRQKWFASFAILYTTIHLLSQTSLSSYVNPSQSDEEYSFLRSTRGAESSPFKEDSSFCHRWDPSAANNRSLQPFDLWLTHHPTWVVSNETDEQFCVEPGNKHDHPHIHHQLQFYANQFHSSCERVHIRTM